MPLILFFLALPLVGFGWFEHHWPWIWSPMILGFGILFLLTARGQATNALAIASYRLRTNRPAPKAPTFSRAGLWGGTALGVFLGLPGAGAVGEATGKEIDNLICHDESDSYLNQSLCNFEIASKEAIARFGNNAIFIFAVILWLLYLSQKPDDFFWWGVTKTAWIAILLLAMAFLTVVYVALDALLLVASAVKYFVTDAERLEWVFPITKGAWSYLWQKIVLNWYYDHVSGWAIVLGIVGLGAIMIVLVANSEPE